MNLDIIKNIQSHLEFLGYQCEFIDEKKENVLLAKSQNKSNLILCFGDSFTRISARYQTQVSPKIEQKLSVVMNGINEVSSCSKWFYETKDVAPDGYSLTIETHYCGYDKTNFGFLLELFEFEIKEHLGKIVDLTS